MKDILLIEKFLADELFLSKKEISLYLFLIKQGPMTILELSEVSGINRVTTHVNIDYLIKKGLVAQIKKGKGSRRFVMAEPAEKISLIFKERKAKLEAAEKQLEYVFQELSGLKKEMLQEDGMEIRRYNGKNEVRLIYDAVLNAKKIRTYACSEDIYKVFPNNIQKFIDAHKKNHDMYIWEIMEDSEKTRKYIEQMVPGRIFYRLITKKLYIPLLSTTIDYLIFDGKVAMVEVVNDEVRGMIIENTNFYETSVAIHEFVWNYLPDNS